MRAIRHLLAQRRLSALICAATLLLKLVVPTGSMIESGHGRIAITICSGTAPRMMMIELPGMQSAMPGHGKSNDHGKAEMSCAFSSVSVAMLTAVDPIQLAALIAIVMALGLVATRAPPLLHPSYLRPPLRAPPTYL